MCVCVQVCVCCVNTYTKGLIVVVDPIRVCVRACVNVPVCFAIAAFLVARSSVRCCVHVVCVHVVCVHVVCVHACQNM